MVQRPRFSLEAAYVGALTLFLIFSIPSLSLQIISFDKVASATVRPSAKFMISIWTGSKIYISDQLSEFAAVVVAEKQDVSESVVKLAKSCESKSASILDRSAEGIKKWQKDQTVGWLIVWRSVSSWIPLAKI